MSLVSSLKQQTVRFAFPYGSRRTVLRGPARGIQFVVEPGIGLTYALGTDAALPRHFAHKVQTGMTVYDVGANKGQMALLFAALVGPSGTVVALEPAPSEYDSLCRNLKINRLAHVHPRRVAAADTDGDLVFTYTADRPTQGKLRDVEPTYVNRGADTFSVRGLTLDALLEDEPRPDVIKIDVEGAAASVLRGAGRVLEEVGPNIYLELHGPEEQAGVKESLLSRGYVAETLAGERVLDPTSGWFSPLWCHKP